MTEVAIIRQKIEAETRTPIKSMRRERADLSREIRDLYKAAVRAETTAEQNALYLSIENLTYRADHLAYQINARTR